MVSSNRAQREKEHSHKLQYKLNLRGASRSVSAGFSTPPQGGYTPHPRELSGHNSHVCCRRQGRRDYFSEASRQYILHKHLHFLEQAYVERLGKGLEARLQPLAGRGRPTALRMIQRHDTRDEVCINRFCRNFQSRIFSV